VVGRPEVAVALGKRLKNRLHIAHAARRKLGSMGKRGERNKIAGVGK
jgi:hypothetical protein